MFILLELNCNNSHILVSIYLLSDNLRIQFKNQVEKNLSYYLDLFCQNVSYFNSLEFPGSASKMGIAQGTIFGPLLFTKFDI